MDLEAFLAQWHDDSPTLLVHTSGSTGQPKPILVEKRRMEASARITCRFLGLHEGDSALLCMPLDYIAGKMMVVRALTCGLHLISVPPSGHPLSTLTADVDLAAMVPLQVRQSLAVPAERQQLMCIRHLLIGGGPVDDELADALAGFPHHVWSTYGMTETLSHIAMRRLNGPERSEWYSPFEGVTLSLTQDGCLTVDAPAVHDGLLLTNDIAELRADGMFRIIGRRDNVVCSGGVKIQMEEIERLLRPHLTIPYIITCAKNQLLGQEVVMLVERTADVGVLDAVCRRVLPKYWCPRRIVQVDRLPMTETGKPARAEAERMADGDTM